MQLTVGDYWSLKHTLLRFLQDRRVKVSLFLQVRGRVCSPPLATMRHRAVSETFSSRACIG